MIVRLGNGLGYRYKESHGRRRFVGMMLMPKTRGMAAAERTEADLSN
jgi:hypothetical protein